MIKQDVVHKVAERTGLPRVKAEAAVDTVFLSMKNALAAGDRIELRGFGVFSVKPRKTGIGRNPKNRRRSADCSRPRCPLQAGQRTAPARLSSPFCFVRYAPSRYVTVCAQASLCVRDFSPRPSVSTTKVSIPACERIDSRVARECYPSSTIMGVPQRQMKAQQTHQSNTVSSSSMRDISAPFSPTDPAIRRRRA